MTITDKKAYETAGGTTLTGTVAAAAGDRVIASVVTRDTFTVPSGWTMLYESGIYDSSVGNGQRAFALYKVVDAAGTVSFTATQASSQRLYLNLISISGCRNVEAYTSLCKTESGTSISVGNKNSGEAIIWALSCAYWSVTPPFPQWTTSPADLTLLDLGTATQSRLGNFIDLGSGATTGRTFIQPTGTSYPISVIAINLSASPYKSSGNAIFASAGITGTAVSSTIAWTEDKPTGTSVSVSVSTDGVRYSAVTNGGQFLPAGTYNNVTAYIKVELSTTDAKITPTVSELHVYLQTAEDMCNLILEMEPLQRFESSAGDITVVYDGGGTLIGEGGPVLAFSKVFTPVDLIPKPHQNDAEHLELSSITVNSVLTRIYYTNTTEQDQGHLEISAISATGVLTNVKDI